MQPLLVSALFQSLATIGASETSTIGGNRRKSRERARRKKEELQIKRERKQSNTRRRQRQNEQLEPSSRFRSRRFAVVVLLLFRHHPPGMRPTWPLERIFSSTRWHCLHVDRNLHGSGSEIGGREQVGGMRGRRSAVGEKKLDEPARADGHSFSKLASRGLKRVKRMLLMPKQMHREPLFQPLRDGEGIEGRRARAARSQTTERKGKAEHALPFLFPLRRGRRRRSFFFHRVLSLSVLSFDHPSNQTHHPGRFILGDCREGKGGKAKGVRG